jgi:toxin ParE1/3/4
VKPLRFGAEARREFRAAADWYAARDSAVSIRFVAAVQRAVDLIRAAPHTHPLATDVPAAVPVRVLRLARFPYAVFFVELPDEVRVLAVAHGRRRPGYWQHRTGGHPQG